MRGNGMRGGTTGVGSDRFVDGPFLRFRALRVVAEALGWWMAEEVTQRAQRYTESTEEDGNEGGFRCDDQRG
jgi:hypothetical protein